MFRFEGGGRTVDERLAGVVSFVVAGAVIPGAPSSFCFRVPEGFCCVEGSYC